MIPEGEGEGGWPENGEDAPVAITGVPGIWSGVGGIAGAQKWGQLDVCRLIFGIWLTPPPLQEYLLLWGVA